MARGSVFPYKGGYAVRYDGPADPEGGRRAQHFKSGFSSEREADAYLAQRLAEVATGRHVAPTRWTFAAFADYWLETLVAGSVRPTSARRYRELVRGRLAPAFGPQRLDAILPGHIHRQYRRWEAEGLAPRTLRLLHSRLVQIFAAAVREGLLSASVMARVTAPRGTHEEMRTWTAAELDRFLTAHCPEAALGTLWRLLAMTGMRRGEALGLRWRDVDRAAGRLFVRQQMQRVEGGLRMLPPKTALGRRTISLDAATLAALEAHRRRQLEERLGYGPRWRDRDLVFAHIPTRRRGERGPGDPLGPDIVTRMWRELVARTGLPAIRLHDLRHTHATLMLRADGNVKALAARLGHDPAVLLRTYAHAMVEDQERAVARLDALLAGARAAHDGAQAAAGEGAL